MTKNSKVILISIVAIVALLCSVFVGCQNFKWGPVGDNTADEAITNNGSVVVQQGNYLYYVNGKDDPATITDPYKNHFGKASVKGSIMKSKINEDGSLSETAVLVPKMYSNTNKNNGLWIQGEWIYYTSPSTRTNNKNVVLVEELEYMRTKLDGTKTQSLGIVKGVDVPYTVTSDALIYYAEGKLMKFPFNEKKTKKAEVIEEEVATALFTQGSNVIFYTKQSEDETKNSNNVYVMDGNSEAIAIATDTTYTSDDKDLKNQKTITPIKYVIEDGVGVLYYGRKNGDTEGAQGTYAYKFTEGFAEIVPANEKKYATTVIQDFVTLGFEKGIIANGTTINKYSPITEDEVNKKGDGVEFTAAPTILFVENNFMYYIESNKLTRMAIGEGQMKIADQISDETVSNAWFNPIKIGSYIYYYDDANYNYLHRLNYNDYKIEQTTDAEGKIVIKEVKAEGKIVSGYDENTQVEGGLVPAFMSQADKDAFINAHPAKKVDKN